MARSTSTRTTEDRRGHRVELGQDALGVRGRGAVAQHDDNRVRGGPVGLRVRGLEGFGGVDEHERVRVVAQGRDELAGTRAATGQDLIVASPSAPRGTPAFAMVFSTATFSPERAKVAAMLWVTVVAISLSSEPATTTVRPPEDTVALTTFTSRR